MPKETLCKQSILKYPELERPYALFINANKYGWAGVLTQLYTDNNDALTQSCAIPADELNTSSTNKADGTLQMIFHPVIYVSGLFRGSQLNWAALTKEAYAIYFSVRKLRFYLTISDVLIRSDHLPLKKFLNKSTMNAKVNNWAVELESYNLKFEYIQGIKKHSC